MLPQCDQANYLVVVFGVCCCCWNLFRYTAEYSCRRHWATYSVSVLTVNLFDAVFKFCFNCSRSFYTAWYCNTSI